MCFEMISRRASTITLQGIKMRLTGLQFPGSHFCTFLKIRSDSHGHPLSGPLDLCALSLFKYSLAWPSCRGWVLPAAYTPGIPNCCSWQKRGQVDINADKLLKTFLVCLLISWEIYFQVSFAFLPVSQCVQTACLHSSQDIFLIFYLLYPYLLHLSFVTIFFFIFLLHFVFIGFSYSGAWKVILESQQILLEVSPLSLYIYIPWVYLKKIQAKVCSPKVQAYGSPSFTALWKTIIS